DFSDILFSLFADAAFVRSSSTCFAASRLTSPKQPFKSVKSHQTESALSLHPRLTRKSRTLPTLDFGASSMQHAVADVAHVLRQRSRFLVSGYSHRHSQPNPEPTCRRSLTGGVKRGLDDLFQPRLKNQSNKETSLA
ncbi:MAG: hypothetical protein ABJG75_06080, partial [Roseobacter sp.]